MLQQMMEEVGIPDYRVIQISSILAQSPESEEFLPQKTGSVLVGFFPYLSKEHDFTGNLSVYAQGKDYHLWVKEKLQTVSERLASLYPKDDFFLQVDVGPWMEKKLAAMTGLGMEGIHSLIIHPVWGSYGFLGILFTTALLEEYLTPKSQCMLCMKCVSSCPGRAIKGDGTIYREKCSSNISQKKGDLDLWEQEILWKSQMAYGCDICQKICPHNREIEFIKNNYKLITNIQPEDVDNISNKDFAAEYKEYAFTWRGPKVIKRNLQLINNPLGKVK